MKIAIATVQVPFITGGAEILTQMLRDELKKRGHEADIVTVPFKWYPARTIMDCMMMGRMLDLSEINGEKIDLVIAMKFPAFYVKHENKVVWLMHQHRQAYDLFGTKYGDLEHMEGGLEVREMIQVHDTKYLQEAKSIFTISDNSRDRLLKYNSLKSETLYHPPLNYEKLGFKELGDFIFYPSRIDQIKRQRVLVEAARYLKTDAKVVIAGGGSKTEIEYLKSLISKYRLQKRVKLAGFISEEEKIDYYAKCLGVYFGAYDEDYGYITLEGFFSKKPVIVHKDAGGPLEFIQDGVNGYVLDENPQAVAAKIDYLYKNRKVAKQMGEQGYLTLLDKNVNWNYVIDKLLGN
ncbi:MAG: glycosyltransferase family 4 protein [Lachnospiraceae bacterium]|nr:glycosyltransferase family 4 protein [Lachnospiraceae bacterium]MBO5176762.1 glycosyltransferase family 4 protein [Lachnospiraceae bacterium]